MDDLMNARKKKYLTQTDLAKQVGVSIASISNYETGRSVPSQDIKSRIEQVVGPVDWDETRIHAYREAIKKEMEDPDGSLHQFREVLHFLQRLQKTIEHPGGDPLIPPQFDERDD